MESPSSYFRCNWTYPTKICVGAGRVVEVGQHCTELAIKRPLFVVDSGLADTVMVRNVIQNMHDAGLSPSVFSDFSANPNSQDVERSVTVLREGGHDCVVALGGGSAMDVGKLAAFMVGQIRPIWDFEDIGDYWARAHAEAILPIIAVPTTAGTGSEVGRAAVVINEKTHEKKIIFHPKMLPSLVIGDPELAIGLPPHLTAATGLDAFTHSFETFCVNSFHPMADGIALESMRLIKTYLPRAYENGEDIEARTYMFAAALMGGVAFQKGLGAVHSISHPLGSLCGIHHGLANAVLLPYVVAFNRPSITEKVVRAASTIGLAGGFDGFMAWLLEFRARHAIPHDLAQMGVDPSLASQIGRMAYDDPSTTTNPRPVTPEDLQFIFESAVKGDLPPSA